MATIADLRPAPVQPDVGELCELCGGEGVDDHWADGVPRRCGACMGTGAAHPVAALVRRVYQRAAHLLTPEEQGQVTAAVVLVARLEEAARG